MRDDARNLWLFMRTRKRYWILPIIVVLLLVGVLLVLTEESVVAPLVYTLF